MSEQPRDPFADDFEHEVQRDREAAELSAEREGIQRGNELVAEAEEPLDGDQAEAPEPFWRKPAEVLRAVPRPKARFSTDVPALDRASGGGAPTGSLIVAQGGPDSGKTGLTIQVAVHIGLKNNVPVWLYTTDGGAEATAIRVGRLLGLDGEKLDDRDPQELQQLDAALAEHRIFIVNDDAEGMNLQRLIAEAEAIDPEIPHILVVDSVQETPPPPPPSGRAPSASERDVVNANIRCLRRAKQSTVPWLIFSTSEVTKSSYSGRGTHQTNPLAAGSDSAKIGYAASMVIHMSGDPGKPPDFGRAAVVKNKLGGGKPTFGLRLETPSLRLLELDEPATEADRQERLRASEEERIHPVAEKVWKYLYNHGPKSGRQLHESLGIHELKISAAIAFLGPRISTVPGPKRSKIHTAVGDPPPPGGPPREVAP